MSDQERLVALLTDLGITFETTESEVRADRTVVEIGTEGPRNDGYPGFVCRFLFDAEGKFVEVGVWE